MKYKIVDWMKPLIDYFWSNKDNIINENEFYFGYPDFLGLPEEIHSQLDIDIVGIIQDGLIQNLQNSRTRTAFAKLMTADLSRGTVIIVS